MGKNTDSNLNKNMSLSMNVIVCVKVLFYVQQVWTLSLIMNLTN